MILQRGFVVCIHQGFEQNLGVEANVRASLNQDAVQRAMANASRPVLNAAGLRGQIVNAFIDGNKVRIQQR